MNSTIIKKSILGTAMTIIAIIMAILTGCRSSNMSKNKEVANDWTWDHNIEIACPWGISDEVKAVASNSFQEFCRQQGLNKDRVGSTQPITLLSGIQTIKILQLSLAQNNEFAFPNF